MTDVVDYESHGLEQLPDIPEGVIVLTCSIYLRGPIVVFDS